VVDAALSPSQTRNLEETVGLPVCDREKVILDVFEKHATTRRARVQVEIANLEYLRPRIRGIGLSMDQQVGGFTTARGPGEKASELLARRLDGRLADLRRRLADLKEADSAQRKHRRRSARVALVGYTNAGKTSLMNALTSAGLSARDRPFETLDTTSRALSRHGGDVLLSDTVGFIRRLPEYLLASFESTLAEVSEATHLVLVVDVSDPEVGEHLRITESMLERLGAGGIPRTVVFNKSDRLDAPMNVDRLTELAGGHPHLLMSSRDVESVAELRRTILDAVRVHHRERTVFVPYDRADIVGKIYATCRVLGTTATPTGTQIVIECEAHVVDDIARATRRRRT
jgi:GTP-binding protein HflX